MNICPKCKSKRVKNLTNIDYKVIALGANPLFKCLECGFEGEIFPEVDDDRTKGKKGRSAKRSKKI